MKKIISLVLTTMILLLTVSPVSAKEQEPIQYRQIVTNLALVGEDSSIISQTITDNGELKLSEDDVWFPLKSESVNEIPFSKKSDYGFTFYYYEIEYKNGDYYKGYETFLSYDDLKSKSNEEIEEVVFYYSYAGMLTVNYKLDSIEGEDIVEPQTSRGRINYSRFDLNQEAESYDIFADIYGYKIKEVIGDLSGEYNYSNQEVTIIYEKAIPEEPSNPGGKPVEPNEKNSIKFNVIFEESDFANKSMKPDEIEFRLVDEEWNIISKDYLFFNEENGWSVNLDNISSLPEGWLPTFWYVSSIKPYTYSFNSEKTFAEFNNQNDEINLYFDLDKSSVKIKLEEGKGEPTFGESCISMASIGLDEGGLSGYQYNILDENMNVIKTVETNSEGEIEFDLPFGDYLVESLFTNANETKMFPISLVKHGKDIFECKYNINWLIDKPVDPVDPVQPGLPGGKPTEPLTPEVPTTPIEQEKNNDGKETIIVENKKTPNTGVSTVNIIGYVALGLVAITTIATIVKKSKKVK